jgi:hypothetical protein
VATFLDDINAHRISQILNEVHHLYWLGNFVSGLSLVMTLRYPSLHNIVVFIHTVVTFQALHDYLRPRVSGLSSGSRLSGMFAALAASGYGGSSSKPPDEPPKLTDPTASAPVQSTSQRRRSQRLAKQAHSTSATSTLNNNLPETNLSAGNVISNAESASDIVGDSEFQAEFLDDENFDAEVFDDEIDSVSEKTVTLSIAEGLLALPDDKISPHPLLFQTVVKSKHKSQIVWELT